MGVLAWIRTGQRRNGRIGGSGTFVGARMHVEEARDIAAELGLPSEVVRIAVTDFGFGTTSDLVAVDFPDHVLGGARRIQAGWPFLALRGYWMIMEPDEETGLMSTKRRWALSVEGAKRPVPLLPWPGGFGGEGSERPLPLLPIWPGFVVNTLFYAAVLWLLICGPFALRRFIRIRHGLCPACGYPMGESSICSECGAELPRRTEAMT